MKDDDWDLEVILFDLGGVLVHWDGVEPLVRLSGGILGPEDARRFWIESPSVRRVERGECSPQAVAESVVAEIPLPIPPQAFLEEIISWDRGPIPGALELLDEISKEFRVACLSNNNELHWARLRDRHGLGGRFHRAYLSHEIGQVKPDPETFRHVLADLACPPSSILFLDDSPECVDAARKLGLVAFRVSGVDGAREVLGRLALL